MTILRWILGIIIVIILFNKVLPGCKNISLGCNKAKEESYEKQGFTVQRLDADGNILHSTHCTTDWAGDVGNGFYRIIPDSANTVLVKLPGYYIKNKWHEGNQVVLTNSGGQDLTLPETGQSQPMPTRGPGLIEVVSAKTK